MAQLSNPRSWSAVMLRPIQCPIPSNGNSKQVVISQKKIAKNSIFTEFFLASKRRRTDLINTVGGAKALDKIKDMVDLPANQFTLEYDHSLLRYRTMTEADYGFLYCWAENLAGQQVCIRNIIMPLKDRTSSR